MKLLIDIPEEDYNECKMQVEMIKQEGLLVESLNTALKIFVANGIPLPKGHGRLIDADDFREYIASGIDGLIMSKDKFYKVLEVTKGFLKDIDEQPTIMEADKAERSEE